MKTYYTLPEYMVAKEGWELTEGSIEWAKKLLITSVTEYGAIHIGDCTRVPSTCFLCSLERTLEEYRQYRFAETPICRYCEESIPSQELEDSTPVPVCCNHCKELYGK